MAAATMATLSTGLAAVILAAGRGTRMCSDLPKVLHRVRGRTMLAHVLQQAHDVGARHIVVVVGYGADAVIDEACAWARGAVDGGGGECTTSLHFAMQTEQLGTAHAVQQASATLDAIGATRVLVLCGDVPLLRAQTLHRLLVETQAACVLLTVVLDDPRGFGRIVRSKSTDRLQRVVEERDCASDAERGVQEVNAGVYVFDWRVLRNVLSQIGNDNAQQEYYLTDSVRLLVAVGAENNAVVAVRHAGDAAECMGVNTVAQLAEADARARACAQ